MNQGTAVAGGSGGSGGGDGNAGEGGDNENANGGGGGNDANGGQNGAGGCGAGGTGGCPNCGNKPAAGDPVDVLTGTVFTTPKRDLFLPGPFNLEILRSYSAQNRSHDSGMGWGWSHTLGWTLERRGPLLELRAGDGRRVGLPFPDKTGQPLMNGAWSVLRGNDYVAVRPGNEFIHYFRPIEPGANQYRLVTVAYRNRGHISLHYQGPHLGLVLDSVGRGIVVDRGKDGRMASLSVNDPGGGGTIVFARYAYDSDGNLVAAADADGHITSYAYDQAHRLTRLEYPNGLVFHYCYDAKGRCIETWGAYKDGVDPALAPDVTAVLRDGRRAKGIYHCRLVFGRDYTEVVDSVRIQRYFASATGAGLSKGVSATGGVTTRTYDDRGRVTSRTDATEGVWAYAYDDLDDLVAETDPEGRTVRIDRDGGGRPTRITDPAGGTVQVVRNAEGDVETITDQKGGATQFFYGDRGLPQRIADPRGASRTFSYDAHGNLVQLVLPGGGALHWTYDYWGRRLTETNAAGSTTGYGYSPSGRLVRVGDSVGRAFTYEYDSMGNRVREVRPDGAAFKEEYAGLNWRHRVIHPDGSEIRVHYNREGWPFRMINELGETWELEYSPLGVVRSERDFLGRTVRCGHDALGRTVWVDDGEGRRNFSLNKVGQVVTDEAADGSIRTYEYNPRGELVRASSGDVDFVWDRDATGEIVGEEIRVDGKTYVVAMPRDATGKREALRTSLGHEVQLARDSNGLVREIHARGATVLSVDRDPSGAPLKRLFASGGAMLSTFDPEYRLVRRQVVRAGDLAVSGNQPEWVGAGRGAARTYEYTPLDELRCVSSDENTGFEYEYDVRRHVVARRKGGVEDARFRTDAAGNYSEVGPRAPLRTYARGGQVVAQGDVRFQYDARGFLVEKATESKDGGGTARTRFDWNAWGLLAAVSLPDGTRVDFKYDAFARRVSKRTVRVDGEIETHHYVWDLGALLHDVEVDADGSPKSVRTLFFEDEAEVAPIGHVEQGGYFYYLRDISGCPEEVFDAAGNRVGTFERDVFGRTRRSGGAVATDVRAAGQHLDGETGLHYNRYRYYDPDIGHYVSPDPIGLLGGMNLYAYANPNPVGWIDPMGWDNVATVTGYGGTGPSAVNPGGSPLQYDASWKAANCPDALANPNQQGSHSEQKFCYDLLNSRRKGGAYNIGYPPGTADQLPPCPNCHAAMLRASHESQSTITYQWTGRDGELNTATYTGGTANFTGGAAAQHLQDGYAGIGLQSGPYSWNTQRQQSQVGYTGQDLWGANMNRSPTSGEMPRSAYLAAAQQ